ncbi:hypothetical protein C8T65DRAFT_746231 [Cerioporus squamosus]|nr:hypothetical protein C8T65DRAFT_746231 [Cerioporus squamosus]
MSALSSPHTTPRGRTLLTRAEIQNLDKQALLTLVKTGTRGKGKAAALHFESEDKLRHRLATGGQFTVGWARVSRWIKCPPDPKDAPARGLAQREWHMDCAVLELLKSGKLTHPRSPRSIARLPARVSKPSDTPGKTSTDAPSRAETMQDHTPASDPQPPASAAPSRRSVGRIRSLSSGVSSLGPFERVTLARAVSQPPVLMGPPLDLGRLQGSMPVLPSPKVTVPLPTPLHPPTTVTSGIVRAPSSSQVTSRSSTPSPAERVRCKDGTVLPSLAPPSRLPLALPPPFLDDSHVSQPIPPISSTASASLPSSWPWRPMFGRIRSTVNVTGPSSSSVTASQEVKPVEDVQVPVPTAEDPLSLSAVNKPSEISGSAPQVPGRPEVSNPPPVPLDATPEGEHDRSSAVIGTAPLASHNQHASPVGTGGIVREDVLLQDFGGPESLERDLGVDLPAASSRAASTGGTPDKGKDPAPPTDSNGDGSPEPDSPSQSRSNGTYYPSDDNDSDGARDAADDPLLALIDDTLEEYGFEDWRYQPSSRESSPPSTRPSSRASSESEAITDYSCDYDLHINSKTGLKRYRSLLDAARRRKREASPVHLFHGGDWPETLIWHGRGDVAAFGEDRTVAGESSQIVDVLRDVSLQFDREHGVFTVSSSHLCDLLIHSITVKNVCGYLGVPVKVGGKTSTRRLAFWDQPHGRVRQLQPEFLVELSVLDPKKSSREFSSVRLGVDYITESIASLPPDGAAPVSTALVCRPRTIRVPSRRTGSPAGLDSAGEAVQAGTGDQRADTPLSNLDEEGFSGEDKAHALQEWLYEQFGQSPVYREIRLATRQSSQHAVTLLKWVKFAKQVKDAGPVDESGPPAARGLSVSKAALGAFLDRGHDWIKDALDAQEAIESGAPAVGQVTQRLITKGIMLGAKTLARQCMAARAGEELPALPRRGRGKTGNASDSPEEDIEPRSSPRPEPVRKVKPKPRPVTLKARTPVQEDDATDRDGEGEFVEPSPPRNQLSLRGSSRSNLAGMFSDGVQDHDPYQPRRGRVESGAHGKNGSHTASEEGEEMDGEDKDGVEEDSEENDGEEKDREGEDSEEDRHVECLARAEDSGAEGDEESQEEEGAAEEVAQTDVKGKARAHSPGTDSILNDSPPMPKLRARLPPRPPPSDDSHVDTPPAPKKAKRQLARLPPETGAPAPQANMPRPQASPTSSGKAAGDRPLVATRPRPNSRAPSVNPSNGKRLFMIQVDPRKK